MKKYKTGMLLSLALVFTAIADLATSTSTLLMWYEPDCPEELIK